MTVANFISLNDYLFSSIHVSIFSLLGQSKNLVLFMWKCVLAFRLHRADNVIQGPSVNRMRTFVNEIMHTVKCWDPILKSDFINMEQHTQIFMAVFFSPKTLFLDFHRFCLIFFTFHTTLLERARSYTKILYFFIWTKTPCFPSSQLYCNSSTRFSHCGLKP